MDMPDVGVAVSTGAVGTIVGAVVAWWKAKQPRKIEPDPLHVEKTGPFVTCGECKQHRAAIGKRIDTIETSTRTIISKLDEIDTRAEQRSENLHRRLDPIIEKVAGNSAKIEMFDAVIREAAKATTAGGKK